MCIRDRDYIVHVHAKDMLVRSGMNFDPGRGYNLSRGGNYWRGTILDVYKRQAQGD